MTIIDSFCASATSESWTSSGPVSFLGQLQDGDVIFISAVVVVLVVDGLDYINADHWQPSLSSAAPVMFSQSYLIMRNIEIFYNTGWSTLIGRGLSRLCSDWLDHDVAV